MNYKILRNKLIVPQKRRSHVADFLSAPQDQPFLLFLRLSIPVRAGIPPVFQTVTIPATYTRPTSRLLLPACLLPTFGIPHSSIQLSGFKIQLVVLRGSYGAIAPQSSQKLSLHPHSSDRETDLLSSRPVSPVSFIRLSVSNSSPWRSAGGDFCATVRLSANDPPGGGRNLLQLAAAGTFTSNATAEYSGSTNIA